jgi:16S rRNA (cytosine967-C5)-methyltransferase
MPGAAQPAEIRADAARIVASVVAQGRSLDTLLAADTEQGSARGLKRSLCYGTLRWHFRLRAIMARLVNRPVEKLEPVLAALIELGLLQLLIEDVAPHAAVAETVNATRLLGLDKAAGFVNAILRRFQRERDALLIAVDTDLATRTSHPDWLVSALRRDWPEEFESVLEANNQHPPMWLRVNRQRCDPDACIAGLAGAGFKARRHEFAPDAVLVDPPADVRHLPGFGEGLFSVQDVAAQLAAALVEARPGQRILDACAAPGGKTCHVLEQTGGRAELTALDVSAARLEKVEQNLQRLGLSARTLTGDAADPSAWWDGRPFDSILLDVPCSATGVIRRHPDIKVLRRPRDVRTLASRQARMLRASWDLLRPGGKLLYTSCSVLKAENQSVIGDFLAETQTATDSTVTQLHSAFPLQERPGPGYQVLTGQAGMDGFYYACLTRRA